MTRIILPSDGMFIGDGTNEAQIEQDGTVVYSGTATKWEDSMVPSHAVRPSGTTPPTWESGFKGDANMFCLNFVNNQADEINFTIQLPHARKTNSLIYPHVHFCPFVALGAGNYVGQFILKYYYAAIDGAMSAEQTITLTKAWSGENSGFI